MAVKEASNMKLVAFREVKKLAMIRIEAVAKQCLERT